MMVSSLIREEFRSKGSENHWDLKGLSWPELRKVWGQKVEGKFRTLVLDGESRVLASGEAMIFPALGVGAFYPDSTEILDRVLQEARVLLRPSGSWITIRNLRFRKEAGSQCRVYFDWDGE